MLTRELKSQIDRIWGAFWSKEVVHADVTHRTPQEILADLARLESEIQREMTALEKMLG